MRSIESRIITLFILFVLFVQIVGFISLQKGQENQARFVMDTELVNSEQAIQQLLDRHTVKLTEQVAQLVNSAEFVRSVLLDHVGRTNAQNSAQNNTHSLAQRNRIESVLVKQAARINADVGLMVGMDGHIQATSSSQPSTELKKAITSLILSAGPQDYASTVVVDNGVPLQLIAALLKSPAARAWVVMAFPLQDGFIHEISKVTPLQVTVLTKAQDDWRVVSSSLTGAQAAQLAIHLPKTFTSDIEQFALGNTEYSVRMVELAGHASGQAVVAIQGSIGTIFAPYSEIQIGLIAITLLSLGIAVAGHITFTKKISKPLRQLGEVAKRLGKGDYHSSIDVEGDDDICNLARAFTHMRDGIAQREGEIRRLAYWDTLTELPNRVQFTALLKQAIAAINPATQSCYVLVMDLDRFKHVNDIMGHSFGDTLLKRVACRLREALPSSQLARMGGDEFALLLPNSNLEAAQDTAGQILTLLEQPIVLDDQAVDLAASIGLAGFPEHGDDAEILMSHAEVAMYAAKRKVGNNCTIYSPEIDQSSQQNLSLLSELRSAIQQDQLRLYVQPKFSLGKKEVVGVEALVRWMHPVRGFLAPDQFIPFAEQTGIIRLLTRWILDKSAALSAELEAQNIHLKVSVNISTHDLLDQELPMKFADILTRHRVKTSAFCLEITESAIMNDPHRAQATLERLDSMGVELSIDDFGTGYSSLAYLKRLPVQELKIDKSFVMQMEQDEEDRKIVKSTIDLGHNMGLRVVAEGVMSAEVMALLSKMGCDQAQGNYINPAIPSEQFSTWLRRKDHLAIA